MPTTIFQRWFTVHISCLGKPGFTFLLLMFSSCAISAEVSSTGDQHNQKKNIAVDKIYRAYEYEKTICPEILKKIHQDKQLVSDLINYEIRRQKPVVERIKESGVAKNEVMQYLFQHENYITVDVDFHGSPGTNLEGSPVVCFITDARLKEIEALGASEQAWTVREYFLGTSLAILDVPSLEPAGEFGTSIDFISRLFAETKTLYKDPKYRKRLKAWAIRLTAPVKAEISISSKLSPKELADRLFCKYCLGAGEAPTTKDIEAAALAIERHLSMLRDWVSEIESGI